MTKLNAMMETLFRHRTRVSEDMADDLVGKGRERTCKLDRPEGPWQWQPESIH